MLVSAAKGGEPSTYVIEPGIILWSVQVHLASHPPPTPPLHEQHCPCACVYPPDRRWRDACDLNALVQDGAKGYDIIEFCFLRPEFHEVRANLHAQILGFIEAFAGCVFEDVFCVTLLCVCRWSGKTRSTGGTHTRTCATLAPSPFLTPLARSRPHKHTHAARVRAHTCTHVITSTCPQPPPQAGRPLHQPQRGAGSWRAQRQVQRRRR
jgi:hypothetical protein